MTYDYDLFVIGAGSGGVSASRRAAHFGAKVGICEKYRVGGTCVIRGCVPKKLLVYASHISEEMELASDFGWTVDPASFDWKTLIERKDKEIDRLNQIYISMLDKAGVQLVNGAASFIDEHTVEITDEKGAKQKVTAERFLIAVGAKPFMPKIPGIEHAISSNEAFHLESLPKTIAIVGGGYIAVEFAGIFNGMGAQVIQLYRGEQILRGFDNDVRNHLSEEIKKKGIDLRLETNVTAIEKQDSKYQLTLTDNSKLDVDLVMYATGRKPDLEGLNLDSLGIEVNDKGAIAVDEDSQTNFSNIFAIGDVTDRMNLTPVAINEGRAFAEAVYASSPRSINYSIVPSAVFSQPPVSTCGLTEEQARKDFAEVDIYRSEFRPMKFTLGDTQERTMMKLIVDAETQRVLGAHMVGPDAAEIMQGVGVALTCGATKQDFDMTIGIHPSSAEEFVTMREKSQ